MTAVCDAAMPRAGPPSRRRNAYWWTDEIAQLRSLCVSSRRLYTRSRRRRRRDPAREEQLYESYRQAKKSLQLAIRQAKTRAKEELLESLNRDPWGRPFRMVRNKLRPWAPPLTETLCPQVLERVVTTLFPAAAEIRPPPMRRRLRAEADTEVPEITPEELALSAGRMRGNKAPGPDGIPGRACAMAMGALGARLGGVLNTCLESGRFPQHWKEGRLVLLKKDGRPADSPSAYRPIVLLDEVGKIFERIIADRLVEWLGTAGPDLSDVQFGFRPGRSTIDAIQRVKTLSEQAVARGGVALAVSLDIANAFNTLPWVCIREALRYHNVPLYLQRIVESYLSDRFILYRVGSGVIVRRSMACGVPQGSVLGPLLWNIGYDWVLRAALPRGLSVTCYADDTLVLARGSQYEEAASLAVVGVTIIVRRIRQLGLEVALHKTEALCFHGPRRAPPSDASITIEGARVEVGTSMKYLGLVLDGRWSFRAHFARLAPKLLGAAAAFSRLLPNVGGPDTACRRLYLGVVRSMALYGAPIWADSLTDRIAAPLRRPQRVMAVRAIRGYRTISYEAACVLAGSPPWDIDAAVCAEMYRLRADEPATARKRMSRHRVLQLWGERLQHPSAGLRTIEAIRPVLRAWANRRHGRLTYRLTQILSGHGCFGRYLCKIAGREPTTVCHHCDSCNEDTAQHTLEECSAWNGLRRVYVAGAGTADLSLPAVVHAMVSSRESWDAALNFCEAVMLKKEEAEREREAAAGVADIRRTRPGRRRRVRFADPPVPP